MQGIVAKLSRRRNRVTEVKGLLMLAIRKRWAGVSFSPAAWSAQPNFSSDS
jgi:hypothetical protein